MSEENEKTEAKENPRSKKILTLFLLDELRNTDEKHPKNAKELSEAINKRWQEISGQEVHLSDSTIYRQVKDINASGLMEIQTSENKNAGFYRSDSPIDGATASIIAQSMFRATNISWNSTKNILETIMHFTDARGKQYLEHIIDQLGRTTLRRKISTNRIIYAINNTLKAIIDYKKIKFNLYERNERDKEDLVLVTDIRTKKPVEYIVSPYYMVWENDECYLICHWEGNDKGENKFLTHFRLALMANVEILDEETLSIDNMVEFFRYARPYSVHANGEWLPSKITGSERRSWVFSEENQKRKKEGLPPIISKEAALKLFALDRYVRENVYMYHNDKAPDTIKLYFRDEALEEVMTMFGIDKKNIEFNRVTRYFSDGEQVCMACVKAQPNEGLYQWLMQHSNEIIAVKPDYVRKEVQRRLKIALQGIESYEEGTESIDKNLVTDESTHRLMTGMFGFINREIKFD